MLNDYNIIQRENIELKKEIQRLKENYVSFEYFSKMQKEKEYYKKLYENLKLKNC